MKHSLILTLAGSVALAGACGTSVVAPDLLTSGEVRSASVDSELAYGNAFQAAATLRDAAGNPIGTARLTEDGAGRVHVNVHVKGVTPGLHGIHLHAIGTCDGSTSPAFSSAGGHFNPGAKEHGHHNPNGYHAGDLPNLEANRNGVGHLTARLEQFRLADLFDTDGTAVVLHANEDDLLTNSGPAGPGNSGARIACGVIERTR
jgi:superoxide dismutase, Cu-Zn family